MSSAALRPGVARGAYPERDPAREKWGERAVHALRGPFLRARSEAARLEAFVRAVRAQTGALRLESDAGLERQVRGLQRHLVLQGLEEPLLARAFALIREIAQRTLGMGHYDVQLMGGWVLARGMLAEMETGEGKTLTATLPAATAALAGIPVHVISVNDYLVQRDAEAMGPLYTALGLSVGAATEGQRDAGARRAAYACDVTYVTAKQLGFDYLRDGLARGRRGGGQTRDEPLLLRGLCFAIVDEADSVLIDEARTPLILAAAGGSPEQRRTYRQALRLARSLEEGADFRLDPHEAGAALTTRGRERLAELAEPLGGTWTGPRRREEWARQALSALHLFQRDRHYLVRDGKVQIIDQPTGRLAPDRAWEGGLHQLIEVKEGCEPTPQRETIARISYQQLFRRYLRLAGMTGTAREVARELWSVYRLNTRRIPTRLPLRRRNLGLRVFATESAKWEAVVARVGQLHRAARPVLVGTASVAASEQLSRRLSERRLPHQVLNARQDAEEARIVAEAGEPGRITVATHMAGRGTDIRLAAGVAACGGLHVIATQRSEARRIDRQLFGRCGRQGDPGSYESIFSLEDQPMEAFYAAWARPLLARLGHPLGPGLGGALTFLPQRAEEKRHSRMRRALMELEEYMSDVLAFAGPGE